MVQYFTDIRIETPTTGRGGVQHFADIPSPSVLIHLLEGEGSAAFRWHPLSIHVEIPTKRERGVQQSDNLADG